MGLDPVKESSILNQRHLYGLGYARHPFAVAQREQEKVVVENRYRWTERSQKVFLTPIIDTILHAHTRVVLGKIEEHTSELQSRENLVCRLLLEKKKTQERRHITTKRHRCRRS